MEALAPAADCTFIEETLIFDPAAVAARRKRMEIRRFKQQMTGHGVNKRSRPLSVAICDLCEGEQIASPSSKPLSDGDTPPSSQRLAAGIKMEKGNLGRFISKKSSISFRGGRVGGLVRSASFPPEGWEREISGESKYAVKVSKTSRSSTASRGEACHSNTSVNNDDLFHHHPHNHRHSEAEAESDEEEEEEEEEEATTIDAQQGPFRSSPSPPPAASNSAPQDVEQQQAYATTLRGCLNKDGRCPPNGKLLMCGRRREMEDTAAVVPSFMLLPCDALGGCYCEGLKGCRSRSALPLHFFGVYDGHGGDQASKYCSERLHQALAEEVANVASLIERVDGRSPQDWQTQWERAMAAGFLKVDKEVGGVCPNGECSDLGIASSCCSDSIAPENVGSTAVVAVVGPCQIIVGNCGDSRAVMSRAGKAIALSRDHKPEREDETNRIESAGGRVIYWDGYRVGGLLAMSRAIGDRYLKQYVISKPEVTCIQRTEDDECLILASDGLWDVISNDVACDVARRFLATARRKRECGSGSATGEDAPTAAAAALLVKLALARGSRDNISVVVVDLKSRSR